MVPAGCVHGSCLYLVVSGEMWSRRCCGLFWWFWWFGGAGMWTIWPSLWRTVVPLPVQFRPSPDPDSGKSLFLSSLPNSVEDLWHFGVDPEPDPRIHASDKWIRMRIRILLFSSLTFKRPTTVKTNFKKSFCWLLLFQGKFKSFFKDKKSKRINKIVEIKVFVTIYAWW